MKPKLRSPRKALKLTLRKLERIARSDVEAFIGFLTTNTTSRASEWVRNEAKVERKFVKEAVMFVA